jgi:hypothetical protein
LLLAEEAVAVVGALAAPEPAMRAARRDLIAALQGD